MSRVYFGQEVSDACAECGAEINDRGPDPEYPGQGRYAVYCGSRCRMRAFRRRKAAAPA